MISKEIYNLDSAVFAGSFDPITKGHIDIINRAARLVDTLYIAIGINDTKFAPMLDIKERVSKIKQAIGSISNIKVITFDGLLTDCMRAIGVRVIVRGIRNIRDYEYERELEQIYKSQDNSVDCIYILADPRLAHISSSVVRQLDKLSADISEFV